MNAPERLGLSAQEAAIVLGKRAVHDNVSERVLRLFERAVYFTESFKETEGQPIVLRWAKALLHTTRNISINIFEDELIVGRRTTGSASTIIYPELDGSLMIDAIDAFRAASPRASRRRGHHRR